MTTATPTGYFLSFYDVGGFDQEPLPTPDLWVKPLAWTLPSKQPRAAINAYMAGQTMNTPSDIREANPADNELPYSAMLAITNSYLAITPKYADRVSTTLGLVGPSALGEEAQKLVHKIIEADEPQGWDTQLNDEFVFQLARARTWRSWVSASGGIDLLTNAEASIGTVQSAVNAGATLRAGQRLANSYSTTLFSSARIANPSALDGGWFFYTGFQVGYVFNQIFADGNTFEDSRSLDYQPEFIAATAGASFSFRALSLTLALTDFNILQSGSEEQTLENLTQFGTITVAWRL